MLIALCRNVHKAYGCIPFFIRSILNKSMTVIVCCSSVVSHVYEKQKREIKEFTKLTDELKQRFLSRDISPKFIAEQKKQLKNTLYNLNWKFFRISTMQQYDTRLNYYMSEMNLVVVLFFALNDHKLTVNEIVRMHWIQHATHFLIRQFGSEKI